MKKAIFAISALIASSFAFSAGSGIEGYWGYNDKVDPYNPQQKVQQVQQPQQLNPYQQGLVYQQAYPIQQPVQGYYYIPVPIGQMPAMQMAVPAVTQNQVVQQGTYNPQAIQPPNLIPGSNAVLPPNGIPVINQQYSQENQIAQPVKQNEQPVSIRVISLSKEEYDQSLKNPIIADTLEDAIRAKSSSNAAVKSEVPTPKKVYKMYNPKTQEVTEIVR